MLSDRVRDSLAGDLKAIREAGTEKPERVLESPQGGRIRCGGREVLNLCANNYLGLAGHPELVRAAKDALDRWGYGLSSVRFICGTQELHKELERAVARFIGTDDAVLYSSCFDANGGLFETLLTKDDAVISDALNHASIIDGIRLCKAERRRFAHSDMTELEKNLKEARGARRRLVATDGVFSMDGDLARLGEICDLAEQYDALVMIDDSHATGFVGPTGRGTHEACGVLGRVDIVTSTFGKALGGASGGFTAARSQIVDLLRQHSRPYLFSNTLAPAVAGASLAAIRLLETEGAALRARLEENTRFFREGITALGFDVKPGTHPIVPVMLGEARLAAEMAADLLVEGVYVVGFSYPVVPRGEARIRVQMSAVLTREDIESALAAFEKVGRKRGVL